LSRGLRALTLPWQVETQKKSETQAIAKIYSAFAVKFSEVWQKHFVTAMCTEVFSEFW